MSLSDYPFVGRFVRYLLIAVIAIVVVNDGLKVSSAFDECGAAMNAAMAAAVDVVSVAPDASEEASAAASAAASAKAGRLESYAQEAGVNLGVKNVTIRIEVSAEIRGSIVAGPVWRLIKQTDAPRITLRSKKQVDVMGAGD